MTASAKTNLPLKHEFLTLMLGVRRAGVTEALQSVKRQKLIDTARNQIRMLDRKGRACGGECLWGARKEIPAAHRLRSLHVIRGPAFKPYMRTLLGCTVRRWR